ncbi:threonine-phosphate decarboxylase CobD [Roseobacter litoralis]|uniref:threonine-phosphate decarboxylase n=1 Tax=Roseobacter litoralis (strain ATCC 49566 / DSM 6996 / JCM 21268 / NBRC 15278 / OCh 149) TaxID=391595 RepID=F7ZM00_ROSLO|nr:threonine-phosphate decarboxylase CobD [Roseobacter litoralis]AEI95394.1 threonine-phosphate decarboxylase CobC [Roseobacter litoralis Och 149]
MTTIRRDHGGGIDAARRRFGGSRIGWIDLSTGINPVAYPTLPVAQNCWTALPDQMASDRLLEAARALWRVPSDAAIIAAPGASALIAQIPGLATPGAVCIPIPTYNEHAAAFDAHRWSVGTDADAAAQVVVHPNNPDGRFWRDDMLPAPKATLTIIDESFCDVAPEKSLIHLATRPGTIVLKSFGKFWGLAGLRLGFAIGDPALIATLQSRQGPWAVAGPALDIGTRALSDTAWADATRTRLTQDSARLDALMQNADAQLIGGTSLFRLYRVCDAARWQERLAEHHIWTRVFPYNKEWLRLGLPHSVQWERLENALA